MTGGRYSNFVSNRSMHWAEASAAGLLVLNTSTSEPLLSGF
eukprot:COSAG01_NODE_31965_length_587_cov_2.237219_1_plen_40_part_10